MNTTLDRGVRRPRAAVLAAAIAAAVVVTALTPPAPAAAAMPAVTGDNVVAETFSTGAQQWAPVAGSWSLQSSAYRQTAVDTGASVAALSGREFDDGTFGVDLQLLSQGGSATNWAGIHLRRAADSDTPFDSGYTVFLRANGELQIYRVNQALTTVATGLNMTQPHRLTVETVGTSIKVYLDASTTPVATVSDPAFRQGGFALTTFSSSWSFDNVSASADQPDYRISVGGKQLLYGDAYLDQTIDSSFVTMKAANGKVRTLLTKDAHQLDSYTAADDVLLSNRTQSTPNQGWIDLANADWVTYDFFPVWIQNIHRVSSTELLAFTHNEPKRRNETTAVLPDYSVGLAFSDDDGTTWTYLGTIAMPGNRKLNVGGVPFIIQNGNFYAYYNDGTAGEPTNPLGWVRHASVITAPVADVVAAARNGTVSTWKKYVSGGFTGAATGSNSQAPAGAAILPDVYGSQDLHSDASYNTELGRYLMTTQDQFTGRLILWSSSGPLDWRIEKIVDRAPASYMNPYSAFIDPDGPVADMSQTDEAFWILFDEKGCPNTGGNYSVDNIYRSQITIVTKEDASATAGFSSQQGANGWNYEQRNANGTFSALTWNAAGTRWVGTSANTLVTSTGQHPDTLPSVRTWTATEAGTVRVTGRVAKAQDALSGDGVSASILKNTTRVWPASAPAAIGAADAVGVGHDVLVDVAAGDKLRFVVEAGATISFDSTSWAPTVTYESTSASAGFSSTQGARDWRYTRAAGEPLTWDASNSRWAKPGTWNIVANNWQHPDAQPTTRTWTAPRAGTVEIRSRISKKDSGGDGVYYRIVRNGASVLPASGAWYLGGTDTTGVQIDGSLRVAAGDVIGFEVSGGSSFLTDATYWNPDIRYVD
jgi:hypothetical protein